MEKVIEWAKANKMIVIAAIAGILLFALRKFIKPKRKKKRSYRPMRAASRRRRSYSPKKAARAPKRAKRLYSKSGKRLRPWQIKGSLAARRHMAQIRKKR